MFQEAESSAAVVQAQLRLDRARIAAAGKRLREFAPRAVVTCARGSSDHAATYAKYLVETRAGVLTSSCAPSISSVYGVPQRMNKCLFIAISQSGQSPDLVAAARAARNAGALVMVLVNMPDSPLAMTADIVLPLRAGPELSTAATKSFIASLSTLVHLVGEWTGDAALLDALGESPALLARAWALDWQAAVAPLRTSQHLYTIARGVGLGIAQEAALKCKETCRLHAEAFSGAEVRHGPQALLDEEFPALVFSQDDETRDGLKALARDLVERRVQVMVAGFSLPGALALPTVAAHPAIEPLLLAQSFYKLANAVSLARHCDPDQPPHLRKITETR
ncbi:MAG: SIS domain-containing protein [Betaproteobacteria bacterium]|nr:SIS domain-containing protein [Betaproteobacteria bacterium]